MLQNEVMGKEKIAVLGGSRGLGAHITKNLLTRGHQVFMVSRTPLSEVAGVIWQPFDFAKDENIEKLIEALTAFAPQKIIYCAGGGPYGLFGEKQWKDQVWAHKVTFQFPAQLLWHWCRGQSLLSAESFILMGSSVAEDRPDPRAAMYCASKHALKGLVTSLQQEYPQKDIQLFSPPYMDTQLLPPGAWPRQQKDLVRSPQDVAQEFLQKLLG